MKKSIEFLLSSLIRIILIWAKKEFVSGGQLIQFFCFLQCCQNDWDTLQNIDALFENIDAFKFDNVRKIDFQEHPRS
jgi:hypothetical protein